MPSRRRMSCGSAGPSTMDSPFLTTWPSCTRVFFFFGTSSSQRSEERRGGEEGRSRWGPYHLKKKKDSSMVVGEVSCMLAKYSPTLTQLSGSWDYVYVRSSRRLVDACLVLVDCGRVWLQAYSCNH